MTLKHLLSEVAKHSSYSLHNLLYNSIGTESLMDARGIRRARWALRKCSTVTNMGVSAILEKMVRLQVLEKMVR